MTSVRPSLLLKGALLACALLLPRSHAAAQAPMELEEGAKVKVVIGEGAKLRPGRVFWGNVTRSNGTGLGFTNLQGRRYFIRWKHIRSVNGVPVGEEGASETRARPVKRRSRPPKGGVLKRFAPVIKLAAGTPVSLVVGKGAKYPVGTVLRGRLTKANAAGLRFKTVGGKRHFVPWRHIDDIDYPEPAPPSQPRLKPPPGSPPSGSAKTVKAPEAEKPGKPERKPISSKPDRPDPPPPPKKRIIRSRAPGWAPHIPRPRKARRRAYIPRQRPSWLVTYLEYLDTDVGLGFGLMRGDTVYRIGGRVETAGGGYDTVYPKREVDLPINALIVSLKARTELAKTWEAETRFRTAVTGGSGKTKASDWGWFSENNPPWPHIDSLDIYSESATKLSAWMVDFRLRYHFYKWSRRRSKATAFAGIGYTHESFSFRVEDRTQWYPSLEEASGVPGAREHISGEWLKYRVSYALPVVEIGERLRFGDKLIFTGSFSFTPIGAARDRVQNHIVSTESTSRCTGVALLFSLDGRYVHKDRWLFGVEIDYNKMRMKGRAHIEQNGEFTHTISQRILSNQVFTAFWAGYAW